MGSQTDQASFVGGIYRLLPDALLVIALILAVNSWAVASLLGMPFPGYLITFIIGLLLFFLVVPGRLRMEVLRSRLSLFLATLIVLIAINVAFRGFQTDGVLIVIKSTVMAGLSLTLWACFIHWLEDRDLPRVFLIAGIMTLVFAIISFGPANLKSVVAEYVQGNIKQVDMLWKGWFSGEYGSFEAATNSFRNVYSAAIFVLICGIRYEGWAGKTVILLLSVFMILLNSFSSLAMLACYFVLRVLTAGSRTALVVVAIGTALAFAVQFAPQRDLVSVERYSDKSLTRLDKSTSGRLGQYETALDLIAEKPLFGHGVGKQIDSRRRAKYIHNAFLSYLYWGGASMFIPLLIAYLIALRAFVALGISAVGGGTSHWATIGGCVAFLPFLVRTLIGGSVASIYDNAAALGLAFGLAAYTVMRLQTGNAGK